MKELRIIVENRPHTFHVPTCYDEMNERQYMAAVQHLMRMDESGAFWHRFAGMKPGFFDNLPEWVMMEMDGMVEYIFRLDEPLDHFLIPSLPFRGKLMQEHLLAPKKQLEGMSFQQFMTADTFFSYYCVTQRETFIDRLVASLYLRKHETFITESKHDILVPLEKREAYVHHHLSAVVRFAVFANWILIHNWLAKNFRYLFPRGGSDNGKPQASDWLGLFDSFVGDNIPFIKEYQRLPCMDALRIIDGKIKQQQERK